MLVRAEQEADWRAVEDVTRAAFGEGYEVKIVQKMRSLPEYIPELSLVAVQETGIVGHVLVSRMYLEPDIGWRPVRIAALGPISVVPERQRQGIGSTLMRAAIEISQKLEFDGIALLGHPTYYPRFGFVPASRFGLRFTYEVPDDVAMVLELRPGSLAGTGGLLKYSPAFD